MTALAPLARAAQSVTSPTTAVQNEQTSSAASSAFGLGFESLLKIILTQLTYQDPLKPMDNFEFVSQLAQFSQIQQGQTANDRLEALVKAQAVNQATGLLGTRIDIPAGNTVISGEVTAVAFNNGAALVTIKTADGQTISGISPNAISQVRQGE